MNITFRTDASLQIGTGHVIRCLTLAEALHAGGAQCCFICRELSGNLIELIQQRRFGVTVLPATTQVSVADEVNVEGRPDYATWLATDWSTDVAQTRVCVRAAMVDWLIVDHYTLDARWEQALRPLCRKVMVIDDLADRQHDCDVLLDQNLGRNASDYRQFVPMNCTVLAGPHYALLRPEFAALRDESLHRRATPQLSQLLISMGGVDQFDATSKILMALQDCALPAGLRIIVVMGSQAPWLERVKLLAKEMPWPTDVRVNVNNMAQLMTDSDLAIGAAGGTSWERCCLGLPTLLVLVAENQRSGAVALEQSQSVKLIGSIDAIPSALPSIFNSLVATDVLSQLSQRGRLVTDGSGASRVVNALRNCRG